MGNFNNGVMPPSRSISAVRKNSRNKAISSSSIICQPKKLQEGNHENSNDSRNALSMSQKVIDTSYQQRAQITNSPKPD